MSEASGRQEMERRLVQRSIEDEAFRQRLIEDPKGAVEEELGTRLPEEVRVVTVEETANSIYLVLPSSTPTEGREDVELSNQELESVAWRHTRGVTFGEVLSRLHSRFHLIGVALAGSTVTGVIKLPINLPALLPALIHRSAWKEYSRNFGLRGFESACHSS